MNKIENIKQVKNREDKITYKNKFNDFQEFGSSFKGKRYNIEYEKDPYNKHQNRLYKRAVLGLKVYTQEEIKAMHPQKIERIKRVHKKTQKELNLWKQEKLIVITNKFFSIFSKGSPFCQKLIEVYSEPDPKFINKSSFKDLNISKEDIINRLIDKGLLPNNFLKENETQNPI